MAAGLSTAESSVNTAKRPKEKRRRRTADFFISNTQVNISPDVELPQIPARRSKRLRRKSLQIYREQQQFLDDDNEAIQESASSNMQLPILCITKEMHVEDASVLLSEATTDDITMSEASSDSSHDILTDSSKQTAPLEEDENLVQMDTEASTAEKPKQLRHKRKGSIPVQNAGQLKVRKKTAKSEDSLEDIYMNRLWRTQMPSERPWETIYEEPKEIGRGNRRHEYQSNRRSKRLLTPEEFYTNPKLKRRRSKALRQGWKPLSKKRLEKAEVLVLEKLSLLERELSSDDMGEQQERMFAV